MYFEENIKLTDKQKSSIVGQIQQTFEFYRTQLELPRQRMLELFTATFVFDFDRGNGKSSLCFPKLYEHLQKIAPRLVSNDPKWVITPLVASRDAENADHLTKASMFNQAENSQLYLNYIWGLGDCSEKLDSWSINGLCMNIGWAKVDFVQKTRKKKGYTGNGDTKEVEEIFLEYPTFETPDPLSVYFDPRIEFVEDMRSIIINNDKVYAKDLLENKDLYYKESLEWLEQTGTSTQDMDSKQAQKFTAQGIPFDNNTDNPYVTTKEFYGYIEFGTKDNYDCRLVLVTLANDSTILECKEIPFLPFEKFSPSKIPNQAIGVGALSPILDMHKAYNLTRNQRFDNVSIVINRMWLMRRGAGIDPRKLKSFAGNVIDVSTFDDVQPLATPDVTQSSYEETAALNTEMQTTTGTIDTTQDNSGNGFTNLATGQKIRWAEFNSRFKYYKANLERSLGKLGMKMLMMTAYRATMNPAILDKETSKFYSIAKEMFDEFSDFFTVEVLADSTSYDSVANQRDDAIAKATISKEYAQLGVPVDLTQSYLDTMRTFPGTDESKLLKPQQMMPSPVSPSNAPMSARTTSGDQLSQSLNMNTLNNV